MKFSNLEIGMQLKWTLLLLSLFFKTHCALPSKRTSSISLQFSTASMALSRINKSTSNLLTSFTVLHSTSLYGTLLKNDSVIWNERIQIMDKTGSEWLHLMTELPRSFMAGIINTLMFHHSWNKPLTRMWQLILTLISNTFKSEKLHQMRGLHLIGLKCIALERNPRITMNSNLLQWSEEGQKCKLYPFTI